MEQTHHHSHHSSVASERPSAEALLKYMLDHNTHHAKELETLVEQLNTSGHAQAAAATREALDHYREGNARLMHATELASRDSDPESL